MLMGNPLPFVEAYVEQLSASLESHQPKAGLTLGQQAWLSFGLMGIIVTESVCWRKWVRAGVGRYSEALLSWYFRGLMAWGVLLSCSVRLVLESFGTWEGCCTGRYGQATCEGDAADSLCALFQG